MTIDQVVKAGYFKSEMYWSWSDFSIGLLLFSTILLIIGLFFISFMLHDFDGFVTFGFCVFILGGLIFTSNFLKTTEFDKTKWAEEYVKPYCTSIEKEKYEIVFIKIDPEVSNSVSGSMFLGTGSISTNTDNLTPLIVSYKENGKIRTYSNWLNTEMTLTKEEKPYIEFKRVPRDLGHGYKAGKYEIKVYLPEGYEFTDIK